MWVCPQSTLPVHFTLTQTQTTAHKKFYHAMKAVSKWRQITPRPKYRNAAPHSCCKRLETEDTLADQNKTEEHCTNCKLRRQLRYCSRTQTCMPLTASFILPSGPLSARPGPHILRKRQLLTQIRFKHIAWGEPWPTPNEKQAHARNLKIQVRKQTDAR